MTGSRSNRSVLVLALLALASSLVLGPTRADASATVPTEMASGVAGNKHVLGLSPTNFQAFLSYSGHVGQEQRWLPLPGKVITFWVGGKLMCSATTVLHGSPGESAYYTEATCSAKLGIQAALKYHSFVAKFAGDDTYLPSSVTQVLK
ncbi:hypothetical protein [Nocardioides marmorisolisilvae]|uniref:Uncharacterized protein n=1 Tax=Nocardioides marmorisolisilvae TaxID=1542737 RepID=A0A3N0DX71_9ACTN|nr:hypothetical protein [Nocardioides marmorisolisilvae]RNL80043.1 hypothetical protein EFL95_14085 [Nocardioides marmorisolisilvae]